MVVQRFPNGAWWCISFILSCWFEFRNHIYLNCLQKNYNSSHTGPSCYFIGGSTWSGLVASRLVFVCVFLVSLLCFYFPLACLFP